MPVPTPRGPVVDDLHGAAVPDPYRWLEDPADDDVRSWVEAQNAATRAHLDGLPLQEAFRARLTALLDHPRRSVPWRRGAAWLQLRNDGLQDQDVLWTAGADPLAAGTPPLPADRHWRVLLDPNAWSEAGTTSLADVSLSRDGALLAHARSEAGSDWLTWRILDVGTGEDLGDEVRWAKFTSAAWLPDGSGFVYGAYPEPTAGREHVDTTRGHQLRLHRLGAATDPVVFDHPDDPDLQVQPEVTHDGRWLVATSTRGTERASRIDAAPIDERGELGPFRRILGDGVTAWTFLGVVGPEWWLRTDLDAPRGRIVAVHPDRPDQMREVVPAGDEPIVTARIVGAATPDDGGWLVVETLRHATSRLTVRDLDGAMVADLSPHLATVTGQAGGRHDDALFVASTTFTTPATVFRHALPDGTAEVVHATGPDDDGPELVTEQVFVEHDGATAGPGPVTVPVFLVRRADVAPTGQVPTVLYGYGGFDIPVTPTFRAGWRAWVERGGLLAVACLRGGGEYGTTWYDDGRLVNKQHTFDDALAVADWLTEAWTSPAHLGIEGRSNGGLLVGACLTQRPEAFGCAVPQVGVLDLLRFHRFTIGWAWASDYGTADDPEAFAWLRSWSPLHNVREGISYPATLVTTADTDDRVVPLHSYKFAAALQHAQAGDAPILLRVDTSAGHGAGTPVSKVVAEQADVLAFEAAHLGLR